MKSCAAWIWVLVLGCGPQDTATEFTIRINHDGEERTARVRLPDGLDGEKPVGVVLNFHGYLSNADQQASHTGLPDAAAKRGLVSVHPDGHRNSWNAGPTCCGDAKDSGTDDVGFVDKLLDEVGKRVTVDPKRVFALGLSNGGFFSYRLACERADRFAAIVSVAGVNGMKDCNPSRPVPLLHFHGTDDQIVKYEGGQYDFVGAEQSVSDWAERLNCQGDPSESLRQGEVHCDARSTCDGSSEAVLCTIDGGGHTWPGADEVPLLGHVTRDVDATEMALDFFEKHPMP
ncbi:MAG: prolyl oligopeptidase family serine peptidase [Myxococcota bacterium]